MNPDDFKTSTAGTLVPTIQNCRAFVPNSLPPPNLDLAGLIAPIANAARGLGELSGIGRTLHSPHLLIRPYIRTEAVASSKIEGTVTTISELFLFEAGEPQAALEDAREVHNYVRALEHGLKALDKLPISNRMMREMHAILLEGVTKGRGAGIVPGEFKTDQDWIGARLIQNARFVPPPPKETLDAMAALEKYINSPSPDIPTVVDLALIHYQFETVHPFPDGNGRIGRLLIPLILCERKEISQPLLYLSSFFEKNYNEYIDKMLEVSRSGVWRPWIEFFLRAVIETTGDAIEKARALQDLHMVHHARIQRARSSALLGKIIDLLFEIPVVTIPFVSDRLGIAYNATKNNMAKLEAEKIVRSGDRGRPRFFFADDVISIISR